MNQQTLKAHPKGTRNDTEQMNGERTVDWTPPMKEWQQQQQKWPKHPKHTVQTDKTQDTL